MPIKWIFFTLGLYFARNAQYAQLFDSDNPEYVLGARSDELILLKTRHAQVEQINTIFEIDNNVSLKINSKRICDYGRSGDKLWTCKHSDSYSLWILDISNNKKHRILKDTFSDSCLGYDKFIEDQYLLRVVPCTSKKILRLRVQFENVPQNNQNKNELSRDLIEQLPGRNKHGIYFNGM